MVVSAEVVGWVVLEVVVEPLGEVCEGVVVCANAAVLAIRSELMSACLIMFLPFFARVCIVQPVGDAQSGKRSVQPLVA